MLHLVFIMLIAMSLIPAGDAAGKLMIEGLGVAPAFVAFTRFAIGAAATLPLARPSRTDWRDVFAPTMLARGALLGLGVICILSALRTEPIADVYGAFFVGPILSYFAAALLLRERITLPRTILLLLGFCGVLLVVQPQAGISVGTGFALAAGTFYGAYLTANRALAGRARAEVMLLSQMIICTLILAIPGLLALPTLTLAVIGLATLSALCSMGGNLLLLRVYGQAPASRMAPFVYFQLIAATALGWVVFDALPNQLALIGLALLVISGLATLALRR